MQIKLYHSPNSRSQRIIWLFEELNLDYELITINKSRSTNSSPSNKERVNIPNAVLPLKFPTILINTSDQNIAITESSAIAEFFTEHSAKLRVTSEKIKIQSDYLFWKNYADASFMPNLALKQIFAQIVERTPLPFKWVSLLFKYAFNKGYLDQAIDEQLHRINNHLSQQTWLAGEVFTIADLLLWFPLQACVIAHSNIAQYPAVMRYIKHIQQRPAFQKALAKGQWDDSIFQDYWKKAW